MRFVILAAAVALTPPCYAADPPAVQVIEPGPLPQATTCRDYTTQVSIDGTSQTLSGHACQDPDGTWRMGVGPPPPPVSVVVVYPPPPPAADTQPSYAAYPAYDAPVWGLPLGFGAGAAFNMQPNRDFHRFSGAHAMGRRGFLRFGRHGFTIAGGGHRR